jgi:hypothetical protein
MIEFQSAHKTIIKILITTGINNNSISKIITAHNKKLWIIKQFKIVTINNKTNKQAI